MAQKPTTQIRDLFYEHFPIDPTPALANALIKFVNAYETRGTHPEAFNTPYLGLKPCYFLTKDRDDFFSLFGSTEREVKKLITQNSTGSSKIFGVGSNTIAKIDDYWLEQIIRDVINGIIVLYGTYVESKKPQTTSTTAGLASKYGITNSEVKKIVKAASSVNDNFKVASDPFNLFSIYAAHCFFASNLPDKLKYEAALKCLMLLEYKFFTSLVNHRFKFRPDEDSMRALFESLSAKFDIKQFGTWKQVLLVRATSFLNKDGIHYKTFTEFNDDMAILYAVTDLQTRIRNQINIFTEEFNRVKETRDRIGDYTLSGTDPDGEKAIVDVSDSYDKMTSNVYHDCMSVPHFIDESIVRMVSKFFTSINAAKLKSTLISFSELATKQARAGKQLELGKYEGEQIDVGAQALITSIIQKTYRYLTITNVNLNSVAEILKGTKDAYSSSRINDEGVTYVRRSIVYLIDNIQDSTREATVTSLRTAFVMYIILLSFKYLKK